MAKSLRTVDDAIDAWVEREAVEREWRAKSLADVQFKLGYPKAHIGTMALLDVLPDQIDTMLTTLSRDLAQNTIRQIRNYLYQVFEDARLRRHITYNPVLKPQRRKRPKQKAPQRLSVPQAAVLLIAGDDTFYGLAWWLLMCCGLRSGEICGLRRGDVDLDTATLHIQQQSTDLRGTPHLDTPKGDKTRDVPFPRLLVPVFRLQYAALTRRAAAGLKRGTWVEHQLVFPGRSGKPMNPTSLRHALKRLTDAKRLPPVTTHMLRHTAAGMLATDTCPREVVGAILGHAPQGVTGHYAPPPVSVMRPWVDQLYGDLAREVERQRAERTS